MADEVVRVELLEAQSISDDDSRRLRELLRAMAETGSVDGVRVEVLAEREGGSLLTLLVTAPHELREHEIGAVLVPVFREELQSLCNAILSDVRARANGETT